MKISAFYETPAGALEPVTAINYDGNKYVTIVFNDGSQESVKAGYLFRDVKGSRLSNRTLHVLAGGTLRNYKPRQQKRGVEYALTCRNKALYDILSAKYGWVSTRKEVFAQAKVAALKYLNIGETLAILEDRKIGFGAYIGVAFTVFKASDTVVTIYQDGHTPKFMRGYGKINRAK